jgi:hypothetical protein
MKSTFSKILKTILGMQLALEGTCVSEINPIVFDALTFAISREIMVISLVIFCPFPSNACAFSNRVKDNKYSRSAHVSFWCKSPFSGISLRMCQL